MGIVLLDCPHCGAHKAAFASFGYRVENRSAGRIADDHRAAVAFACPACEKPVVTRVRSILSFPSFTQFAEAIRAFDASPHDLASANFRLASLWPEPPQPIIPEHVPDAVARALGQAERNFVMEGNEEAAGIMYRKALEVGLKDRFPEIGGGLAARIDKLVDAGEITRQLGDWAHQIRLIGNDAVHEVEEMNRADLIALRGFVDAVLRYVFTLPEMVEERRARAVIAQSD